MGGTQEYFGHGSDVPSFRKAGVWEESAGEVPGACLQRGE